MQRFISVAALVVVAGLLRPASISAKQDPVVVIHGPTVVAFFAPVIRAKDQADENEALSDFQLYAAKARKPLHDKGINFLEVYASRFRVQCGCRTTIFRGGKVKVGYYFVAPDKKPQVEYGVMTDTDLVHFAERYFGLSGASAATPSDDCLQVEQVSPNLALKEDTRVRGRITDESGEPFRYSRIELRRFISESEQILVKKVDTDDHGKFDLGVVKQGNYRLLLSPHRGFRQPAKLECRNKNCRLNNVLMANPTDTPGAGCPTR